MKKRLILLGSTGSIGCNTVEVVRNLRDRVAIVALAGGSNWKLLAQQAREFRPQAVALANPAVLSEFEAEVGSGSAGAGGAPRRYVGAEALVRMVEETEADVVVAAMSGAVGLPAVLAALDSGKDVALANKEALVLGGSVVMERARRLGRTIVPVDSEHSAIFQGLRAGSKAEVRRLLLTASGGPFRTLSRTEMARITPEQALRHPTWKMGPKITVDSATLMNKALEIIEAFWLFGLPSDKIQVVVHPQSIVHSLVEFVDGSTICHLGPPDMRIPIQYALTYPDRCPLPGTEIDLAEIGQLTFERPDPARFPSLRLAYEALERGGTATAVFNAANEVAVELFLQGRLAFLRIFDMVEEALREHEAAKEPTLEQIFAADRWARSSVLERLSLN